MPAAHPAGLIEGHASGRNLVVEVRMSQPFLIPGVPDRPKAQAGPPMPRIRRHGEPRLRNSAEEDVVCHGRVLPRQRNEFVRQREDPVRVSHRE